MEYRKKLTGISHAHAIVYTTIGTFLFVGVFVGMKYKIPKEYVVQPQAVATTTKESEMYNLEVFENLNITAKSYIVYDPVSKKVLAQKNNLKAYPLASITKVMTALVAEKTIKEDGEVTIQNSDLEPDGSSGLRIGDVWKRDKLIQYTLSVSSNDGARALARTGGQSLSNSPLVKTSVDNFILEMNNFAKQNNMASLTFSNESGLDVSPGNAGAQGNAYDTALMFWYAYKNASSLFETTTHTQASVKSADGINIAKNTNTLASSIPGLTMSKTGFTDLALGNLGIVVETSIARPIVIVVLHSTKIGRFTDVEILRSATLKAME